MTLKIANDNFDPDELPVDIPASKVKAREWLAEKMKGATVTKIPTVPQPEPKPWKPRRKPQAANDNQESIPLCEALIRDKRHDDAAMVLRYLMLVDVAGMPQEDVKAEIGEQGVEVARRTDFAENGAMRDHGVRISTKAAVSYGNRNAVTDDDIPRPAIAPARPTVGEDNIIAHIDAKAVLAPLRGALGPLLDVFEDALFDRRTLTQIGEARGFKGKQASAAGKALLYVAIDTLREAWNRDKRLAEVEASRAAAAVEKARADHDAANVVFFGRDITRRPGTIYGRSKAA